MDEMYDCYISDMNKAKQDLITLCFSIGIMISDPKHEFHKKTVEERAEWIAKQLRDCGYDTKPVGMSWEHYNENLEHPTSNQICIHRI
jgi:DNA-directed RNA polymerase subunit N (RpoN/RPB10)